MFTVSFLSAPTPPPHKLSSHQTLIHPVGSIRSTHQTKPSPWALGIPPGLGAVGVGWVSGGALALSL